MARTRAFIAALGLTAGVATGALFLTTSGEAPRKPDQLEVGDSVTLPYHFEEEDTWEVDYSNHRVTITRTR